MENDLLWSKIDPLIEGALVEDFGKVGDITSLATISDNQTGTAELIAKEEGIIAGLSIFERVFQKTDPLLRIRLFVEDGTVVQRGMSLTRISGRIVSILKGERTALNFLQRLSGIATYTAQCVKAIQGTGAKIMDTRKTTPQLRLLEKYAVRIGGGQNHRLGLYDMILIKNNHIEACGGISEAVPKCLDYCERKNLKIHIEVETRTLSQVKEAMRFPVHRIMLDNMNLMTMRKAVEIVKRKIKLEASGNISPANIREIAETGVDFISLGSLTHSAKALDLSINILKDEWAEKKKSDSQ